MKKTLTITALSVAVLGLVGFGTFASAQSSEGNYPPIIERLVARFNLDAEEVKEVFAEAREERFEQMQVRFRESFEEKLDAAVADGELTQAQKEAILAQKEELQAQHEGLKELSWEERREKMQGLQEEMQNWADKQGIDWKWLWGFGCGHRGGHFHGKFGPRFFKN